MDDWTYSIGSAMGMWWIAGWSEHSSPEVVEKERPLAEGVVVVFLAHGSGVSPSLAHRFKAAYWPILSGIGPKRLVIVRPGDEATTSLESMIRIICPSLAQATARADEESQLKAMAEFVTGHCQEEWVAYEKDVAELPAFGDAPFFASRLRKLSRGTRHRLSRALSAGFHVSRQKAREDLAPSLAVGA